MLVLKPCIIALTTMNYHKCSFYLASCTYLYTYYMYKLFSVFNLPTEFAEYKLMHFDNVFHSKIPFYVMK